LAFSESLKKRVRQKAHYRCCLCQAVLVEVHHIVPGGEGGSDEEDNSAPLCASCHEIFGANPTKRKFIREARDWWYDTCARRYTPGSDALADVVEAVLREELRKTLPQLAALSLTPEQAEDALADLREDTGRWLRDRNHRLAVESRKTSNGMAAQGQLYSGAHLAALAGLKRDVLHEYRDEMSLKRRQYRRIREQEPSVGRYELSDADRDILATWRAPATHPALEGSSVEVDDVTREELEPDLRHFEREGDPPP
jgi:HNH endonuclease